MTTSSREPESFSQEIASAVAEIDEFQDTISDVLAANGPSRAVEFVHDALTAAAKVIVDDVLTSDEDDEDE